MSFGMIGKKLDSLTAQYESTICLACTTAEATRADIMDENKDIVAQDAAAINSQKPDDVP